MMIKRMEIHDDFFLKKMAALLLCSDIAAQGLEAYTKDLNWAVKDQTCQQCGSVAQGGLHCACTA